MVAVVETFDVPAVASGSDVVAFRFPLAEHPVVAGAITRAPADAP